MLARGQPLTLSVREFELLVAMARRLGAIVKREDLYRSVWGAELRARDRSVDVYVSKLRNKLEAALPDRQFIHTHPGFGYRFQPQPSQDVHMGATRPLKRLSAPVGSQRRVAAHDVVRSAEAGRRVRRQRQSIQRRLSDQLEDGRDRGQRGARSGTRRVRKLE